MSKKNPTTDVLGHMSKEEYIRIYRLNAASTAGIALAGVRIWD